MRGARHATAPAAAAASLDEIAQALGCSRQRAQQLVARALIKARIECERRGIRPEMFFDALTRDGPACRIEPPAVGHALDGREPTAATRARQATRRPLSASR